MNNLTTPDSPLKIDRGEEEIVEHHTWDPEDDDPEFGRKLRKDFASIIGATVAIIALVITFAWIVVMFVKWAINLF